MEINPLSNQNNRNPGNKQGASSRAELFTPYPAIAVPPGGGKMKSIDEKLAVNAINGTAGFSVSLALPECRGMAPEISLQYDSGNGNGPFGLGWAPDIPSIKRKTANGIPRYIDAEDSDTFLLSGADNLVPAFKLNSDGSFARDAQGNYIIDEYDSDNQLFTIRRYRPCVESTFTRIERWMERSTGSIHWKTISASNVVHLFGRNPGCRIAEPTDPRKVFEWLCEFSYDDKGRAILYEYKPEDSAGLNAQYLHDKNRLDGRSVFTNLYLKRIRHGNRLPYLHADDAPPAAWLFETVFDYGEHDHTAPFDEVRSWNVREDAFSRYTAGFDTRTCRLCKRVLFYHHFDELPGGVCVTRSLDLQYSFESGMALLTGLQVSGFCKQDDGAWSGEALPPLSFSYQPPAWNKNIQQLPPGEVPFSDERSTHFIDLYHEGLTGVLREVQSSWLYNKNLGDGAFATPVVLTRIPSLQGIDTQVQLMDLEADGKRQLVHWQNEPRGFFELKDDKWENLQVFPQMPAAGLSDTNLQWIDLTGDGRNDAFLAGDTGGTWYPSFGKKGFSPAQQVIYADSSDKPVFHSAGHQELFCMADMTGDGLTDLVCIKNGEVSYWPNLGYGRFGAKIIMDNSPVFDLPEQFDNRKFILADLDCSGTTDLLYRRENDLFIWRNRQGNSFAGTPVQVALPQSAAKARLFIVDLTGKGVPCIVWNNKLPEQSGASWQYIDLMEGRQPYLLTTYKNNLGKEVVLEYTSSVKYYLDDHKQGQPWITRLPFPVHCVSKVITYDKVRKTSFTSEYTYHHGYFDHSERAFRGFGRVDQRDTETLPPGMTMQPLDQPPVLIKSWFHTGYAGKNNDASPFAHEYYRNTVFNEKSWNGQPFIQDGDDQQAHRACRSLLLRREMYAEDSSAPYTAEQYQPMVRLLQPQGNNRYGVFTCHESEAIVYHYERVAADPRVTHNCKLLLDGYNNILLEAAIAYPRYTAAATPEQQQVHITITERRFSNSISTLQEYRTPLQISGNSYELTGLPVAGYFSIDQLTKAFNEAEPIAFHEVPVNRLQKRIFSLVEEQYRGNDAVTPLPIGAIESKGLKHVTYKAAFNEELLTALFNGKIAYDELQKLLTGGGYVFRDGYYWISSGVQAYDRDHFFLPVSLTDTFGNTTAVTYDRYHLFPQRIADPLGNSNSVKKFNYRVLAPCLVEDANNNGTGFRYDELGRLRKLFRIGKKGTDAGDAFDDTKTEMKNAVDFPYCEYSYHLKGKPAYIHKKVRETHYHAHDTHETKWQQSFTWFDGIGHEILTKEQAEPGDTSPDLRWLANGHCIFNNKNNLVKQYEPYFSAEPVYDDENSMSGVSCLFHYDAPGRLIRTDFPNGTFNLAELGAWQLTVYDQNDTLADSEWYRLRTTGAPPEMPEVEKEAARKTLPHYHTPVIDHMDAMGRTVLHIENDGVDTLQERTQYDVQNNELALTDALGRRVTVTQYDMLGMPLKQAGAENGTHFTIHDAAGEKMLSWDARERRFQFSYDALGRLLQATYTAPPAAPVVFEKIEYGESVDAVTAITNNLRGREHRHYDQSGIITNDRYDFKGNLLATSRQFTAAYGPDINWQEVGSVPTELDIFQGSTSYDAMDRPVRIVFPHLQHTVERAYMPAYNESGLLNSVQLKISDTQSIPVITNIDYNARRQRATIYLANGTRTRYTYDSQTFRLKIVHTLRHHDNAILQDLRYTYDPSGNITQVQDASKAPVFYDGEEVLAVNNYEYDALYRLITATGRKHAGQTDILHGAANTNRRNYPFINSGSIDPRDAMAFRNYTEKFQYDRAGNIVEQQHTARNSSWTRAFEYHNGNNQLTATTAGSFTVRYRYDVHGNLQSTEHLQQMTYDFNDQLKVVDLGGGSTATYVYDASGQRVKKIIQKANGTKSIRYYLGAIELYREFDATSTITLARESLHVMDNSTMVAVLDIPIVAAPGNTAQTMRYCYANHLGSCCLELDERGLLISEEEYFPFGGTSYNAVDAAMEVPARRYRYIAKERDEETGFNYHGARYYVPWLCRWINTDPIGTGDGLNVYIYAGNRPVVAIDDTGHKTRQPSSFGNKAFDKVAGQIFKNFASKGNRVEASYNSKSKEGRIFVETANGDKHAIIFQNNAFDGVSEFAAKYLGDGFTARPERVRFHFTANDIPGKVIKPPPPPSAYETMMADPQTRAALERAARITQVNINDLSAMAIIESNGNRDVGTNRYGYTGLMQLGRTAVNDILRTFPQAAQQGISWQNVQDNVEANALAGAYYWRMNQRSMERNNVPVNATNMYLAHQQGAAGLRNLLSTIARNPNAPLTRNQTTNVPARAGVTTQQQFYNYWNTRMQHIQQSIQRANQQQRMP